MQLALVPRANRFTQWRDTAGGRVLRFIFFNCADRRLFDVARRGKVRLAWAKVGNVDAFRFHFFRFSKHSGGWRDLDSVDAISQLHFQLLHRWASLLSTVYKQEGTAQTPN